MISGRLNVLARRFSLVVAIILILLLPGRVAAKRRGTYLADGGNILLSIGLNARTAFWEINKKDYKLTDTRFVKEGSYSPIEVASSDPGVSIGPEIELFVGRIFIRGYYLIGQYRFDVGDARREDIGADVGVEYVREKIRAGVYVGWRAMRVGFSDWTSENIDETDISDGILGLIFRTNPDKQGWIFNASIALGFHALSSFEGTNIAESDFDLGDRFSAIDLSINAGYGVWVYYEPTTGVIEQYNDFYNEIIKSIHGQSNTAHGPVLRIEYSF